MRTDAEIERLLEDWVATPGEAARLPAAVAGEVVARLKAEADRYWAINANRSLELAEIIVTIGRARSDPGVEALGIMARGDAQRLLGRNHDAWKAFDDAGALFRAAGDEVGWARTRLGRIGVGHSLGRLDDVLRDVDLARATFARHGEAERLVTLDLNLAAVYQLSGRYEQALILYHRARQGCDALGEAGETYRGAIATNLGLLYTTLGDHRRARSCQQEALEIFTRRGDETDAAVARLNLADTYLQQGQYRRALRLLYQVHAFYAEAALPRHAAEAGRSMLEAFLRLNRFEEARQAALAALETFRTFDTTYGQAQTLLLLGMAEPHLGRLDDADAHLEEAQTIFTALDAPAWVAVAQLRRAEVALAQGRLEQAAAWALGARERHEASGREVQAAEAEMILAHVAVARGDDPRAARLIDQALRVARRCDVPDLRYALLVLRGRLCEAGGRLQTARRCYEAAVLTLERIERELTVTLRSDFLQSRGEGSARLFDLNLRLRRVEQAWRTLERRKAHVLAAYLAGRDALRWGVEDARSIQLLAELEELRDEQHWLYRQAHALPEAGAGARPPIDPAIARPRLRACERRLRALSEQLHLSVDERGRADQPALPSLDEVCASLADDTLLIEYGSNGERLWAFLLDRGGLRSVPLAAGMRQVAQTIDLLHANINAALRVGRDGQARGLGATARLLLQRLDAWLRRELPVDWTRYRRLVVVPFGALHYVPFHLLHDDARFLLQRHEVVVMPAAALAARPGPAPDGPARALALAHSDGGRLPHAVLEARMVAERFAGACHVEQAATRRAVAEAHRYRLLHIAAHGEHRPDAPEFSYIELADGQLHADDLFQLDLRCSLVTLSACETGRAVVAPGDDLIGLGRGLIYAGAHTLLLAQWRADDAGTLDLMRRFYDRLASGASKAAALRDTQRAIIADYPDAHPAFWGAFQLVGDGGAL